MGRIEARSLLHPSCPDCGTWVDQAELVLHLQTSHSIPRPVRGVHYNGRHVRPLHRRNVACSAFTRDDLMVQFDVARRVVWNRVADRSRPFDLIPDPDFVWETIRVLAATGVHISDLPLFRSSDLIEQELPGVWKGWVLLWRRVKNQKRLMSPILPKNADMLDWLPRYLDKVKPSTEPAYLKVLGALSRRIQQETGKRPHLNPNRYRHTCATDLKAYGISDSAVCDMIGTTVETLETYTRVDRFETFQRLELLQRRELGPTRTA